MLGVRYNIIEWDDLRRELGKVQKPARYTGGEINARVKDHSSVDVHFALAFPDVYEVGMSHLGSQILYHVLNSRQDVACERVYAPWIDMEKLLREKGWPLFSIESRLPLYVFDIVGFSLQYELTYTNVLAMLDLGRIPLRSRDRTREHPLVIAGGPCAMAAEPLSDFVDAFALGDGEELVLEIVDVYRQWKRSGRPRKDLLIMLSLLEGVYVPSFYSVDYGPDGTIEAIRPKEIPVDPGMHAHMRDTLSKRPSPRKCASLNEDKPGIYVPPERIRRRVVQSLEDAPFPLDPVIPLMEPIHDRAMVEIFRGCTQGCRFCQAGVLYRPVREREAETVKRLAREILARSGYDEVSLVSLSSADYSRIKEVVSALVRGGPCAARVSLPSLRVDSFSVGLAEALGTSTHTGLTLAPEAGSQRMRDVINKKVTEEDIFEASLHAFRAGFSHIKFYFMIGLPGETDEDVAAIADLAVRVRQAGRDLGIRPTVVVSVSGFVPKPHTPFQWEACMVPEEIARRQAILARALRGPGLEFRYHDAEMTRLEAIFSRGDRRLGASLELAFKRGRRFDAWPDRFDPVAWEEIFRETGVDAAFYAHRERGKDEVLPWDHLDSGVRKSYLWKERERALERMLTRDCRAGLCTGCGICPDFGVRVRLAGER